mgnify:CR=1 FL=1
MSVFLITFAFMLTIVIIMAVGVIFGRKAIKGSCGGVNNGNCFCIKKCLKRKRMEADAKV